MITNKRFDNNISVIIAEQETIIAKYPWYQHGKIELLKSLNAISKESAKEKLKELAVFLPNSEKLYLELENNINKKPADLNYSQQTEETKAGINSAKKIVVVGGDYFSKEELDSLKEENIEISNKATQNNNKIVQDFNSPVFYTETLGKIYADQGYFTQSIEVYSQLILLYPEKSTYFALLIDSVKARMNSLKE